MSEECCKRTANGQHEEGCRHAWRNMPTPSQEPDPDGNGRRLWRRKQNPGAILQMNYGQDYVVVRDGSIRRAVGKIVTDPETGQEKHSVVIVRKPNKAEKKQLKKIKHQMAKKAGRE